MKKLIIGSIVVLIWAFTYTQFESAAYAQTPVAPRDGAPAHRTFVEKNGITWTFDKAYLTGKYVSGDWWVVDNGTGVTVVSVDPETVYSPLRNGSMKNPRVLGSETGLDSRGGGITDLAESFPLLLTTNDVLLSSESVPESGNNVNIIGISQSPNKCATKIAEVLTCVDAVQPGRAFRPPLVGPPSNRGAAWRWTTSDLNLNVLPSLPSAAENIRYPIEGGKVESLVRLMERPRIPILNDWNDGFVKPLLSTPRYHERIFTVNGDAMLVLISDEPNKNDLVVPFVQCCIDWYASVLDSYNLGQPKPFSSAHRGAIILGGMLLDDPGMSNPPITSQNGTQFFREVWMTYDVAEGAPGSSVSNIVPDGQSWHGNPWCWRQNPGGDEHEQVYPTFEFCWLTPGSSSQTLFVREVYRGINSKSWGAESLALLAVDGFGNFNHYPFFQYVDRWMGRTQDWSLYEPIVENAELQCDPGFFYPQGSTGSEYQRAMWDAHRESFAFPGQD